MVPVNFLAVLAAAVAQIILGFLWYGPLFGKTWAALMGWTPEAMTAMKNDPQAKKKMTRSYIIMAIGSLLMSYVLAHAIIFAGSYLNASGVSAGLMGGFWNWLGFIVPVTVGTVLWEGKSWKLWFLNASYYLVGLLIMGMILALWQ